MIRKMAERYIEEHGPMSPYTVMRYYAYENDSVIQVERWRDAMEASPNLTEDDSGRFHLTEV